jgi:ATP-binding cassette subfamily B protein AbcA/BmrA
MRLVKVSNTERQELNNAHSNLREIYNLGPVVIAPVAILIAPNPNITAIINNIITLEIG